MIVFLNDIFSAFIALDYDCNVKRDDRVTLGRTIAISLQPVCFTYVNPLNMCNNSNKNDFA